MQRIFLTGVTGQVGSFVAKELLQKGHHLWLLVRGENPHERVRKIFDKLGVSEEHYHVIGGDMCDEKLSLPHIEIDHFVHCAANVSFEKRLSSEVQNTNINGTKNMLHLCQQWKCKIFHYVGTAYVAGQYDEPFSETMLEEGQSFRNAYEESKMHAEKQCIEFARQHNLALKVYRPGIVMAENDGKTLRYTGLYAILKVLDKLQDLQHRKPQERIRVFAIPEIKKHIVGVDCVAQTIRAMIESECHRNETLILCAKNPPTAQQLVAWLREMFSLPALEICGEQIDDANTFERMLSRALSVYESYLNSEPDFDIRYTLKRLRELDVCVTDVTADYFRKMIVYGRRDCWGREKSYTKPLPKKHEYFTQYLPQFVGKEVLPNIHNVNSCFAVKINGCKHSIKIEKGIFVSIDKEDLQPDFVYEVPEEVFEKMIAAQTDPRAAFFAGKTEIVGNIEQGLKIANLLRMFFRTYPFVSEKNYEPALA